MQKTQTIRKVDPITSLQQSHNQYQTYRKENKQKYHYITKQDVIQFTNTLTKQQQETIYKAYLIIQQTENKLTDYLIKEQELNKAYGKETTPLSELSNEQLETIKQKQNKKAEYISYKKGNK